ncbi:hypothetical protein EDC04DRAFT_2678362, partial [Pisolithus marmoratus]
MGKTYVVTVGTEPGVYDTWIEASWKIRGVQYPVHQGFTTREEAERVFQAALARGEVVTVPLIEGKGGTKPTSKKATVKREKSPPAPVPSEISLLRAPNASAIETDSLTQRGVIPSPPPSPVGRLHRTLRESSIPPSPFTEVTQHETVDRDLPPAHVKWVSPGAEFDSPLAHSENVEESPFALMGNWPGHKSPSKGSQTPPSGEAEEHELEKPFPQNRAQVPARGVEYRTLDELVIAGNIDPRIWLPTPVLREFDPAKVKRRPLTRSPSPVKPASSDNTSSFKTPPQCSMTQPHAGSSNVRTSRGRPSRLTPSLSLPDIPSCELTFRCLIAGRPHRHLHVSNQRQMIYTRGSLQRAIALIPHGTAPTSRSSDTRTATKLVLLEFIALLVAFTSLVFRPLHLPSRLKKLRSPSMLTLQFRRFFGKLKLLAMLYKFAMQINIPLRLHHQRPASRRAAASLLVLTFDRRWLEGPNSLLALHGCVRKGRPLRHIHLGRGVSSGS